MTSYGNTGSGILLTVCAIPYFGDLCQLCAIIKKQKTAVVIPTGKKCMVLPVILRAVVCIMNIDL